MAGLNASTAMDFSIGSTEQKMDMSLDDIIKQSKKSTRVPNKGKTKKPNGPNAKAALQKSVASRSSGMRQGKFAEARARNGGGANFPATQAASKRAFSAPINTRSRQIMKNSNEVSGRTAFGKKRNFQRIPNIPAAARNMTVSVVNYASKSGAGRPAGNFRRPNAAVTPAVGIRQVSADPHNSVNQSQSQPQRPKTLDSLFASIRNAPQQAAPKFIAQPGGRRRGGFGGGGRGRGQQQYGARMPYV